MSSSRAQTVVLSTGAIVFFLGWFHSAKAGKVVPPASFIIGTSVTFLIIELIADVSPELGSALAVAIGTTAFFHYGASIREYITADDTPSQATTTSTKTPVHVAPQR